MTIIAVDNERSSLWLLDKAIAGATGDKPALFESAREALTYARAHAVDAAFLDIEMADVSGLALAKQLKEIKGDTNIIFVTGYDSYMPDAFALRASGYVLKPIGQAEVRQELMNLRHPVERPDEGVRVQCFGNFEVFVNGLPVRFNRPKSKEALAYLVDRKGAGISKKELAAVLWEDTPYSRSQQSHLHILLSDLERALKAAGAGQMLVKRRACYAVNPATFRCDYYLYEQGDAAAVNSYHGEYMANYSWGEFRLGSISQMS